MKKYIIIFLLLTNIAFSQDLEIYIPDNKIELSAGSTYKLCYEIKNHSKYYYKVLIDSTGFSTSENEWIDEPYLGLMDLRILDAQKIVPTVSGSHEYERTTEKDSPSEQELNTFKKSLKKTHKDISRLSTLYEISKRIICIAPSSNVSMCTKISLPIYNSAADNGSLLYRLDNDKQYSLQLHLNIPKKMVRNISEILNNKEGSYKIFSGEMNSNKIGVSVIDPH
ncbi:hypothetical protein [uncultured Chryseobacterium sp.]|uniref:hypothetical protein n=1 Tax=uncultured Chryseobacterium sp. TaxID=259322 RepID=UPI0025DA247C|nr:hypothetical protein [uncultured Chryseobacterium sp.]